MHGGGMRDQGGERNVGVPAILQGINHLGWERELVTAQLY